MLGSGLKVRISNSTFCVLIFGLGLRLVLRKEILEKPTCLGVVTKEAVVVGGLE